MKKVMTKCVVVLGLLCTLFMLCGVSYAQNPMPTEPLYEGEKKYGRYERFMDPVNEKRCMDYVKQWEMVTDFDGNPLPADDPYVKQLAEERKKYGVSARDLQNENQWYMKFMETKDWYTPFNLTMIRGDGQIRYRHYGLQSEASDASWPIVHCHPLLSQYGAVDLDDS